nr:MAG TPA: hypothetical protein [Caudoviricetes sp.]DAQ57624.1 MAG TPA: hypothetical protein [Caudoviricetes sp.]
MWQAMPPLFLLGSLCFGRLEGAYFILFWHLVQSAPLPAVFWLALQLVWLWFPTLCLIGRLSCLLAFPFYLLPGMYFVPHFFGTIRLY